MFLFCTNVLLLLPSIDRHFRMRESGQNLATIEDYVSFLCKCVICCRPSIGASSTPAHLFGLLSSYYRIVIAIIFVLLCHLLTVAVNDYLMRYTPYTVRLMIYVTESILHTKFLFPKVGKSAVFVLFFVPYCRAVIDFIVEYVQFRRYQNRTAPLWVKMLLIIHFFSQGHIKEAIVLDMVADLMPVTLICNHEVETTKLCHIRHISIFFILQLGFYYKKLFNHFDTEKRVSLLL